MHKTRGRGRGRVASAALGLLFLGGAASAAPPTDLAIAPPEEALTLARIATAQGPRLVLVSAYTAQTVTVHELPAGDRPAGDDPLALYRAVGAEGLRALAGAAGPARPVPARALLQPLMPGNRHIAVGTNFPAHADESDVDEGPFLFPKRVAVSGPRAEISAGGRLLDFEVELCFVNLAARSPGELPRDWGLVLCNDFTDRASLLRHLDPDDVVSGQGFTTGKSFPGSLPIGDLLVIPRDPRAFAAAVELRLYRNGELRQQSRQDRAIWDIDEILRQAWQQRARRWDHAGRPLGLFADDGTLAAGSLILAGTPDGTIFAGISAGQKLRGLLRWLGGGGRGALAARVIETYIADAQAAGDFLQAGEQVLIRVDRLGSIHSRIVSTPAAAAAPPDGA